MKQDLKLIASVLASRPNQVVVRGHATRETMPADSKFLDAWHLSYARANAAAKYLVAHGIVERRILLSAAGDSEPRIRSRDKKIQRENRRVDVFVIDAYTTPDSASDNGTL